MHYIFKNWLFFSIVGILAHLKIEVLKAENGDTLPGLQGTSPVSPPHFYSVKMEAYFPVSRIPVLCFHLILLCGLFAFRTWGNVFKDL